MARAEHRCRVCCARAPSLSPPSVLRPRAAAHRCAPVRRRGGGGAAHRDQASHAPSGQAPASTQTHRGRGPRAGGAAFDQGLDRPGARVDPARPRLALVGLSAGQRRWARRMGATAPWRYAGPLGGPAVPSRGPAAAWAHWPTPQGMPARAQRSASPSRGKRQATPTPSPSREGARPVRNGAGPAGLCRCPRRAPPGARGKRTWAGHAGRSRSTTAGVWCRIA
jgi:hypothetical protein